MIKQCAGCPVTFEDNGYMNKLYHSVSCRTRSKRHRAVERDKSVSTTQVPQVVAMTERGVTVMHNPTVEALEIEAKKYLDDPKRQPTMIFQSIPEWTPPAGVWLGPTGVASTEKPTKWLLCHEEF